MPVSQTNGSRRPEGFIIAEILNYVATMLRAEKSIARYTDLSVLRILKMLRGSTQYVGWNLAS